MSDASDKLARSRQAILEHIARRQRRHDPREEPQGFAFEEGPGPDNDDDDRQDGGGGWFGHMRRAVRTWWRYHPAQMAVDLASPMFRSYARRRPVQLVAIAARRAPR